MEWPKKELLVSTDKQKSDLAFIHHYLSEESYLSEAIPCEVQKSIDNPVCFGIYHGAQQVGFARMSTEEATFGYLADVFIDYSFCGRGLSKWLMEVIMEYPSFQRLRRIMLATKDTQGLYAQCGFVHPANHQEIMYIRGPGIYKRNPK